MLCGFLCACCGLDFICELSTFLDPYACYFVFVIDLDGSASLLISHVPKCKGSKCSTVTQPICWAKLVLSYTNLDLFICEL